jgi:arsenate reductase (thioredoxin)
MAEALFNARAAELGVEHRAVSAGTVAGKHLNPMAVQAMEEIGVSMAGQQPKLLTQEMVDRSQIIITMGCGVEAEACPARFLVSEDWGLDDPAGQGIESVRAIRDHIRDRVETLLKELSD